MLRSLMVPAAVAAVLAAAGCGGGSSSDSPPAASVERMLGDFEAAYQAKDAAAIAAMCDYPFEMDGVAIGSAGALRAFLQASFDAAGDFQRVELLDRTIAEDGDRVTVTGSFHVVDATNGESSDPVTISGVRIDGVWKASGFTRND